MWIHNSVKKTALLLAQCEIKTALLLAQCDEESVPLLGQRVVETEFRLALCEAAHLL